MALESLSLVLDCDGVIVHPWGFGRYIDREFPASRAPMKEFFAGPFTGCLLGSDDLKGAIAPFLRRWNWPGTVDELLALWFEKENNVEQELIDTVQRLRARGVKTYVATNQEKYRTHYLRTTMRFDQLFDGVFSSSMVGAKKPDPEFFMRVQAAIGVPAEKLLFWDDVSENIAAARECGWSAELYSNFADFTKVMSGKGIF